MVGRRRWFVLHGWLGLPVGALLFFVCVTGTIAVVSHEITWLFDPRVRAMNPGERPPIGFEAVAAVVHRTYPEAAVLSINQREPYLATSVGVGLPDVPFATVYVNRYTGAVQGIAKGLTFPGFIRSLHGWLLLPWDRGTSIGYYLVGALALVLLGLLVSGLMFHRRVVHTLRRPRIRKERGERVFWGDLHRLVAAWSVWFVASVGLTGTWFLTQGVLWDAEVAFEEPPPPTIAREQVPVSSRGRPTGGVGLDGAVAAAAAAVPGLDVKWILMPDNGLGHVGVYGKQWFPLMGDFAASAQVNPYTGAVASSRRVADLTPIRMMDQVSDPLHYGSFGGLWSKVVWVVFGLGLSGLVFSGLVVWTRRVARRTLVDAGATPPVIPTLAMAKEIE